VVLTGVVLRRADDEQQWGGVVSTQVLMRDYPDRDIDAYIERGEPFDKAGGYAIQDTVLRPVEAVEGCYLNVVGMPLCAVAAGLHALGVQLTAADERVPPCAYCRLGADVVSVRSG
jgi:septum formation protein